MDVLTRAQRSYCMSKIRSKNTKPEILIRKLLWSQGLRYRLHYSLPGKPDIVFVSSKLAVFVDGCFWHGCPEHCNRSKTNTRFWDTKIRSNIERDKKNKTLLKSMGWKVLRFWEHEIENSPLKVLRIILYKNKNARKKQKRFQG